MKSSLLVKMAENNTTGMDSRGKTPRALGWGGRERWGGGFSTGGR